MFDFQAHSGFGYVGSFFNISIGDHLLKLKDLAEKFCSKTWPEVSGSCLSSLTEVTICWATKSKNFMGQLKGS